MKRIIMVSGVTVVVYDDVSEPEMLTGIIYGVSLGDHPNWRVGKPEISMSVKSNDLRWL